MPLDDELVSTQQCQDSLVKVWIVGFVICLILLGSQLYEELFVGHETAAIAWCAQTFSPLLVTMLAKWQGLITVVTDSKVRLLVFRLTYGLSVVYLLAAFVILWETAPATTQGTLVKDSAGRIVALESWSAFLGLMLVPLGVLVTACFQGKTVRGKPKNKVTPRT
jgi:hypothetical protein